MPNKSEEKHRRLTAEGDLETSVMQLEGVLDSWLLTVLGAEELIHYKASRRFVEGIKREYMFNDE